MPTYFVHVKEHYFKDNLSRVKCISQLEIHIKEYEGKITFVSDLLPLIFCEIADENSKELTKSKLEQELINSLPFVSYIEQANLLKIVKKGIDF